MPHLSLRDVPQATYDALKRLSVRERRSVQQQAILLLDAAQVLEPQQGVLARAAVWRKRLEGRNLPDVNEILREDRERRL